MTINTQHEEMMRRCFVLAQKGKGLVSPNPLVGAVLVMNGKIVSEGYHRNFGGSHAEVECLRNYYGDLRSATLYVNLEPCSYHGKTPPCTDLLVQRGIRRVVLAMKDPNPLVAGKGIAALRKAGIRVTTGVLESEATFLNRFFVKHITTHTPYVHLKIAQSLDGFIAKNKRAMQYISSVESRTLVHQWRTEYDAVLVGAGTIKADNPQLNTRMAIGREPEVVILDGSLSVSGKEKVFSTAKSRRILLFANERAWKRNRTIVSFLQKRGVHVIPFSSRSGVIPLMRVLREIYQWQIGSLLVEAGTNLSNQFVEQNAVDEFSLFIAPQWLGTGVGGLADRNAEKVASWFLHNEFTVRSSGRDSLTNGLVINR